MALSGSLNSAKELALGYQSLLLATFQFTDGTYLRLSTKPLNVSEGGYQYGGADYLGRLLDENIQAIQSRSEQGIDRIPQVSLKIADPDATIWNGYEQDAYKGFKGATLTLTFTFWEADTGNFASDSLTWVFVCDAPQQRDAQGNITVTANASHNLQKVDLPVWKIQPRCANNFPATLAQRQDGADNEDSPFWNCGYCPDGSGGNVCGNGSYTTCNYTPADCKARGMYTQDSSSRWTSRYSGEQWAPPNREVRSKSYAQGKTITVFDSQNPNLYDQYVPMLYGTQWLEPVQLNMVQDGNSARLEAVICQDDITQYGILMVLVNDHVIPQWYGTGDPLYRWQFCTDNGHLSTGDRSGARSNDAGYNDTSGHPLGDPHGGKATIEIVVYLDLVGGGGSPNVRILARGPKLRVYTNATTYTKQFTANPVWQLMDLLIWSNYKYSQIDIANFVTASAYCDPSVSYTDLNGNTSSHARFRSSFALTKRQKASDVVQSLLQSFDGQLGYGPTGLLQLQIHQTLADQQPSAIAGSNYNTAVLSMHANGTAANGYVAYLFDESNIDGPVKITSRPNSDSPNRVNFGFQDEDNRWQDDSITMVDTADIARSGGYGGSQETPASVNITGVCNFDQGIRDANVYLAETLRGNEIGDTRGTRYFEVSSNFRGVHLKVGQICMVRFQQLGLEPATPLQSPSGTPVMGILARLIKIAPTTDWEKATYTLQWHEDIWYTDAYGQQPARFYSDPSKHKPARLPYPWQPNGEIPMGSNALGRNSNFALAQVYSKDSAGNTIATLVVNGVPPANSFGAVAPPLVGTQGTTANSGGSITGGQTIVMCISAKDSTGKYSPLSKPCLVSIPTGTNTNTATSATVNWQTGTSGYILFAGPDEQHMAVQASGTTTPSSFTLTSLANSTYGPPDVLFYRFLPQVKLERHGGPWGQQVSVVGSGTLKFNGATFSTNQWAGRVVSLYAKYQSQVNVPIKDFLVSSNTSDTLTVTPDPSSNSIVTGDVFVMRHKATTYSATTIGDSNIVNCYYPSGDNVSEAGYIVRIIAGTGANQWRNIASNNSTIYTVDKAWDVTPDSTSIFVIEESTWQTVNATDKYQTTIPNAGSVLICNINVTNWQALSAIVRVLTVSSDGLQSLEAYSPWRAQYIWGFGENVVTVTDDYTVAVTDQNIQVDTSSNAVTVTLMPMSAIRTKPLAITKITPDSNHVTILPASGDTIAGASNYVLSQKNDSFTLKPGS